jgi:hypothetical protein
MLGRTRKARVRRSGYVGPQTRVSSGLEEPSAVGKAWGMVQAIDKIPGVSLMSEQRQARACSDVGGGGGN